MVHRKRPLLVAARLTPHEKRMVELAAEAEQVSVDALIRSTLLPFVKARLRRDLGADGPEHFSHILRRALAEVGIDLDDLLAHNTRGAA